jgi:hypothetical protein
MMAPLSPGRLLSVRAALVLLIAVVVGLVAGILDYFRMGIATAALIGGGGADSALALFHILLDRQ